MEVLKHVAMATNFWTQFAITGFMSYNHSCMIGNDMLCDSRGGLSGSSCPMEDIVSKGHCHGNQFWD